MPRRRLTPVSYGGEGLQSLGKTSWFDFEDGAMDTPEHEPILLERTGGFPSRVRTQPREKVLPLNVTFKSKDTEGQARLLGRVFDPVLGPQILVVRDLNNVERRMTVEPRRIVAVADAPQDDRQWVVPLVAARPLWENNLLTTFTDDIDSGTDPVSHAARNAGNYDAPPVFHATGRLAKYATQGYALLREITYAWRGDSPATGPVTGTWLIEVTDGGLDTSTIVDVSAITETVTAPSISAGTIIDRDNTLDLTVTDTSDWDQEGLLLAEPGTGSEEQFEYYVVNATTIRLTGRALGGTTAQNHIINFTIHQSRMLVNGDDIAIFIDNDKVPDEKVWLDGMDGATTKIWVEITDVPNKPAVIRTGGSLEDLTLLLEDDRHGFSVGDYIVGDWTGGEEEMRVTAINGRDISVLRGQRNTQQRAMTTGDFVWKSNRHIQLAYNWTQAPARPTSDTDIRPLIDLNQSTNVKWFWVTGVAPNNKLFNEGDERRPGGWRPIIYPGSEAVPTNRLNSKVGLRHLSGADRVSFEDRDPDGVWPNFDAVEFVSACGITSSLFGIQYDAEVGWPFALQVIARDKLGRDHLISTRLGHETPDSHEPPASYTNRTEVINFSDATALILRARNSIVTGIAVPGSTDETLGAALSAEVDAQAFVLDAATRIDGMVTRARESTSGVLLLLMQINRDESGVGAAVTGFADHSITTSPAIFREVCCFFSESPVLAAGTYYYVPFDDNAAGVLAVVKSSESLYSRGAHWEGTPFVEDPAEDLWFAILSTEADNQPEVVTRTNENLDLDAIQIQFNNATGQEKFPIVTMEAEETAYYYDTEWSRGDQDFRVRYLKRYEDVFRAAGMELATGTYVGDAGQQSITGLGFQPEVVIVFRDAGSTHVYHSSMGAGSMHWDGSAGPDITGISSIDADGFTVEFGLSSNGVTYYWFAIGSNGGLVTGGSYTAPGGASGSVTGVGFTPEMVWGFNGTVSRDGAIRTKTMEALASKEIGTAGVQVFNEIRTFDADGFGFGNGETMNRNGTDTVYWIAFAKADWLQLFTYTGDGVDDRNILAGEFMYALIMPFTTQHSNHRPSSVTGDQAHLLDSGGTLVANKIQTLNPNIQVGTHAEVNGSGNIYHGFAFAVPGGLAAHRADSDITIDVLAKTIVDNEFGDSIRTTLLASSDDWVTVPPGNQTVTVEGQQKSAEDDVGANREEHIMEFRDTWQS